VRPADLALTALLCVRSEALRTRELGEPFGETSFGSPITAVDFVAGDETMDARAQQTTAIDEAAAMFGRSPVLGELVADVEPLRPDESFDIPDMTDAEWEDFLAALRD
jgi:hypothetical protein